MPTLTVKETAELQMLHPAFASKLLAGWDACERKGLRLALRSFGGLRTPAIQQQLLEWRNAADKKDGIIGGGADYYRVAPAGTSHHEYGAAVDLWPTFAHQRTEAGYRLMADTMQEHGLRAGYYFTPPRDEFHVEDNIPLSVARERWAGYVKQTATKWATIAGAMLLLIVAVMVLSPSGRT